MAGITQEEMEADDAGCAVIVTYDPDEALAERLRPLLAQVRSIIIVDNGSAAEHLERLRDIARNPHFRLVRNGENVGVASALNQGIALAVRSNHRWVLLLDQDSCVASDMVSTFLAIYADFPDRERLAVIGSGYADRPGRVWQRAELWERTESVITSGSFLPLDTHARIGPFRDDYFIDYVDTEYCLRANRGGYAVIQSRRPLMAHSIGDPTRHRLFWTTKVTTNHSAERRYYMARNTTALLREYGGYRGAGWAVKGFQRGLRLCKRILLYESDKSRKIAAVIEGWWDGVQGRMGPRRSGRPSNKRIG